MNALTRIRWPWVLLGAVLVEVALLIVAIPMYLLPNGAIIVLYAVLPLCLIGGFFGGLWVARKAGRLFVLHGVLVGAVAALLYAALTWKTALPAIYVASNYLKLIAGAAGGLVAQRMATRGASPHAA